jgi:hypothetical protein
LNCILRFQEGLEGLVVQEGQGGLAEHAELILLDSNGQVLLEGPVDQEAQEHPLLRCCILDSSDYPALESEELVVDWVAVVELGPPSGWRTPLH